MNELALSSETFWDERRRRIQWTMQTQEYQGESMSQWHRMQLREISNRLRIWACDTSLRHRFMCTNVGRSVSMIRLCLTNSSTTESVDIGCIWTTEHQRISTPEKWHRYILKPMDHMIIECTLASVRPGAYRFYVDGIDLGIRSFHSIDWLECIQSYIHCVHSYYGAYTYIKDMHRALDRLLWIPHPFKINDETRFMYAHMMGTTEAERVRNAYCLGTCIYKRMYEWTTHGYDLNQGTCTMVSCEHNHSGPLVFESEHMQTREARSNVYKDVLYLMCRDV